MSTPISRSNGWRRRNNHRSSLRNGTSGCLVPICAISAPPHARRSSNIFSTAASPVPTNPVFCSLHPRPATTASCFTPPNILRLPPHLHHHTAVDGSSSTSSITPPPTQQQQEEEHEWDFESITTSSSGGYGYSSDDDDDDDVVENNNYDDNNVSGVEPLDNATSGRRGGATVMDLDGSMVKGCHVFPVFSVEDIIIEPRPTATPIRTNMQITLVEGTMGLLVCDPLILTTTPLRVHTQIVRGGVEPLVAHVSIDSNTRKTCKISKGFRLGRVIVVNVDDRVNVIHSVINDNNNNNNNDEDWNAAASAQYQQQQQQQQEVDEYQDREHEQRLWLLRRENHDFMERSQHRENNSNNDVNM